MAGGGLRSARILGSGGFHPTDLRETSCLLLRGADGAALVVDAGTGLRRLLTDRRLLDGAESVDLVLTHFHMDHVVGLTWLDDLALPVRVWGPGEALRGRPTAELLGQALDDVFAPGALGAIASIGELRPGDQRIGSFDVCARIQEHHPGRSMGLRFGDRLVWCTDTAYDEETVGFARGAEVLGHDAWGFGDEPDETASHTAARQAAAIATAAGVPRLVLIHVPPHGVEDRLLAEASAGHPDVRVAHDLLEPLGP